MGQILLQGQTALQLTLGPVVQAADGRTAMPGLLASGSTLTASANGSATTLITSAAPGVSAGQVLIPQTGANTGGLAYVTGVAGSGPYTTSFSPALAHATQSGDTLQAADLGVLLSKNAGGFSVPAGAGLTDIGRGYYALAASAADTGAAGELLIAWDVYGATAGVSNEKSYQITAGVPAAVETYATGQDPATLALDAAASGHNGAGSIGAKINAAGSAGDPLASTVPGAYAAGTAGYNLGRNALQTGDSYARLGAPAGASVSADIYSANSSLAIVLGLVGQNSGVRNQIYDVNGNLVSADLCSYDSPAHAGLNDGATGLVHRWGLTAAYTSGQQTGQALAQEL